MTEFSGHLILVVGPSGAGKDSVINGAAAHFASDPRVVFPRRVVTRKANVLAEDHDSLTVSAFSEAMAKGAFSIWWAAHNNSYGIPVSIEADLAAGRSVVFNCSRDVIADVARRFLRTTVVDVTAPRDVLVERIVARGRETHDQALARASRQVQPFPPHIKVVRIENTGPLQMAIDALCAVIAP